MSKPDGIPQDIWDEAVAIELGRPGFQRGYVGDIANEIAVMPVARAILAERERCVAEIEAIVPSARNKIGRDLVDAIRKGE